MPKDTLLINMSDAAAKRQLMIEIGRLSGLYEVYIKPRKRTRSLDANRYYFAAVVAPFTEWLRENWGDGSIDKDQAHEMLKVKILGLTEKQIPSGETVTIIPHSKTLSVEEFSNYIDHCAEWLREFCGILVVPSEMFYEGETLGKQETQLSNRLKQFQEGLVEDNE